MDLGVIFEIGIQKSSISTGFIGVVDGGDRHARNLVLQMLLSFPEAGDSKSFTLAPPQFFILHSAFNEE